MHEPVPSPAQGAAVDHVQGRIDAARAVLIRLLQEVLAAETRGGVGSREAELLEANQQLVIAALREQDKAEAATLALQRSAQSPPGDAQAQSAQAQAALAQRPQQALREANERLVLAALDAQELRDAADRARGRQVEFMAVVAQELNNPMAPIRLASTMLGRSESQEQLLQRAQAIIDQQARHMADLVSAVQDVSRANTTTLGADDEAVDLALVITAQASACEQTLALRQQHLRLQLPEHPLWVRGVPARLAQIVANLLDNASRYSHERGEIVLAVELLDDAVKLSVSDQGIGITPLAMPTIFEPFVQDSQAIGFNGVGVGIGLTVARALVEAHRGSILAESAGSGCGSCFTVVLPLVAPPQEAGGAPAGLLAPTDAPGLDDPT
jgi:signal transduction histidine kinase